MAQEKKCKKLLMVKLMSNMTITAPASFITLPQIWQKNSTLNPHITELWPDERSIYCHSLQAGKYLDKTLSMRLLCLSADPDWTNFGSITSLAQLLLCQRWEAGGSSLSISSAGSTKNILQKQLFHLLSHRFFSAITGNTFATKLNKPKYLFSFKIP